MRKTLIKRKKSGKSRRRNKRTRKNNKKGGGLGSDLRQKLVTLYREGKWEEYDAITQQISTDYHSGKKDFFFHLKNQIKTFSPETILSLERSLSQLKMKGIPEAIIYLKQVPQTLIQMLVDSFNVATHTIKTHSEPDELNYTEVWEKYDDITQHIIKNYRMYDSDNPASEYYNPDGKLGFFNYLKYNIQIGHDAVKNAPIMIKTNFERNTLESLERTLTQLQEDGIPESMVYLHVITDFLDELRKKEELLEKSL